MPPRNGRAGSSSYYHSPLARSNPGSGAYNLSVNPKEAYRDLLIFEERLKQNSARLASQRKKYEAFLLSLILSILVLAYSVFLAPSQYKLFQFLNSGLLLIGIVTLVLFFATGVYSEKIAYAYKFVPQANRALRYFNIYLNTKQPPRRWSLNPFRLFRAPPPPPISTGNTPACSSPSSPAKPTVSLPPRPRVQASLSSTSLSTRSRSPLSGSRAKPLAPIPPSLNPRGELIFSSKVSDPFKEGYEKYREEWEKRRRPLSNEYGWFKWLKSIFVEVDKRRLGNVAKIKKGGNHHTTSTDSRTSLDGKEQRERRRRVARASIGSSSGAYLPGDISDSSVASSTRETNNGGSPSSGRLSSRDTATGGGGSLPRGRDTSQRPLYRTLSSSSIASSSMSLSPPQSRGSSPLGDGHPRKNSVSSGTFQSDPSPTPELIREEDEGDEAAEDAGYYGARKSSSYHRSTRRELARSGSSSASTSPPSSSATPRQDQTYTHIQQSSSSSSSINESSLFMTTHSINAYRIDVDAELRKERLRQDSKEESVGFGNRRLRANSFNEFLEELREGEHEEG